MDNEEMKDFETMVEALSTILNLKKKLEGHIQSNDDCCEDKDCDGCEDDEAEGECQFLLELEEDYGKILLWAFGKDRPSLKKTMRKTWIRLHPDLPMPRIIKSEQGLSPAMSSICMLIDVLPLYLVEKKKCAG